MFNRLLTLLKGAPARTLNIRAYMAKSLAQGLVGLCLGISLFYFVLVRPFSSGFDLSSVDTQEGAQTNQGEGAQGQGIENHLTGLRAVALSGENQGTHATLDELEYRADGQRPILSNLEVDGRGDDALRIGLASPGNSDQIYHISKGAQGLFQGMEIDAENVDVNLEQSSLQTFGTTRLVSDGLELQADEGVWIVETGEIEVLGEND